MKHEYERKSALWSLPWTLITFWSFFIIVTHHVEVRSAFLMQEAIQDTIEGAGRPYLQADVSDAESFWDWMEASAMGVFFEQNLDLRPIPGRVELYNQIIGG